MIGMNRYINNNSMADEKMNIQNMTQADFMKVPEIDWDKELGGFNSLIILPTRRKHDSGYRCMYFIACRYNEPIARLAGGSDVIHLDGIGGYGKNWLEKYRTCPQLIPPSGWNIDCLMKSGLLRLFTHGILSTGSALSSFEVYTEPDEKINKKLN